MAHSIQSSLFTAAIYAFGVIGLFGIALLPIRAFSLIRTNISLWATGRNGKLLLISIFIVCSALLFLYIELTVGVSRCLLGYYCSANRAGGWFKLCSIGVIYSFFELASALFRHMSREVSGVAT